jgi:hypothetical protein
MGFLSAAKLGLFEAVLVLSKKVRGSPGSKVGRPARPAHGRRVTVAALLC